MSWMHALNKRTKNVTLELNFKQVCGAWVRIHLPKIGTTNWYLPFAIKNSLNKVLGTNGSGSFLRKDFIKSAMVSTSMEDRS